MQGLYISDLSEVSKKVNYKTGGRNILKVVRIEKEHFTTKNPRF